MNDAELEWAKLELESKRLKLERGKLRLARRQAEMEFSARRFRRGLMVSALVVAAGVGTFLAHEWFAAQEFAFQLQQFETVMNAPTGGEAAARAAGLQIMFPDHFPVPEFFKGKLATVAELRGAVKQNRAENQLAKNSN